MSYTTDLALTADSFVIYKGKKVLKRIRLQLADTSPFLPYIVRWDTTTASEGGHSILVYARTKHGRRAAVRVPIVVANAPTFPPSLASNWAAHRATSEL